MRKFHQISMLGFMGIKSVSRVNRLLKTTAIINTRRNLIYSSTMIFISNYAFNSSVSLNDYYEIEVEANLNDGEMKEVQVGPQKDDAVLVAKVDGKYYCISNKCSHYGAPLSQGPLFDDKIKCPWHNAAFSVKDGSMEGGPMFNGLQTFPVELQQDGKLHIKIDKSKLNVSRQLNMVTRGDDQNHYIIIGGGAAGQSAAESLRQGGFTGRISILTAEDTLPYDRTPMSKFLLQANPNMVKIRDKQFYDTYGIDVLTNTYVEQIDPISQSIKIRQGEQLKYDKLLIATGGSPNRPQIDGINLKNVFTLRTLNDAVNIKNQVKSAKNVIIVGASFIGLESASAIKKELKDNVNVTVVGTGSVAFESTLGNKIGGALQNLHQQNGINFIMNNSLKEIQGTEQVAKVILQNGEQLEADLVILGTGIKPNVGFIEGLKISQGGIATDVFLKTNFQNIYAAGDVASFPYWLSGEQVRVEHHNEAVYQGFVAAMNMIGNPTPMAQVPFFWTRHWDKTLNYSGIGKGYDDIIIDGDINELSFVAYYALKGKIVASASMNKSNAQMIISEALRLNVMPTVQELNEQKIGLQEISARVKSKKGSCNCKRAATCKIDL